jgi:hypothetical protein
MLRIKHKYDLTKNSVEWFNVVSLTIRVQIIQGNKLFEGTGFEPVMLLNIKFTV